MFSRVISSAVAVGLLIITAAPTADAQETARSFDQLRVLLKAGDTVRVTEASGRQVNGKVASLSSSSLELLTEGHRTTWSEDDVTSISHRRHASLASGAKWGFGLGVAIGGLGGLAACHDYSDAPCAALVPLAAAVYGGLGSGIGVGISALISHRRVIYTRPGTTSTRTTPSTNPATVTVSPLVTRERKGMQLRLGF